MNHNNLLTEEIHYLKVFKITNTDNKLEVFYNDHAIQGQKIQSKLSRVDVYEILDSISEIKDIIYEKSLEILKMSEMRGSMIVVENILGFDYQFWVRPSTKNNVRIVLNTSIYHPKNLRNIGYNSPTIVVTKNGDVLLKESKELYISNNKIITFFK